MSVMCCIFVPEGIIMAADSRLTRTRTRTRTSAPVELPAEEGIRKYRVDRTTYTLSDNAQKVFLLSKSKVGISFCGDTIIDGIALADYIRRFEIDKIEKGDTADVVAKKLSEHYTGNGTLFFVTGYIGDVPFVSQVNNKGVKRFNAVIPSAPVVASDSEDVKDDTSQEDTSQIEADPIITYSAVWGGKDTAITKILNDEPKLNADWEIMPLKDAIDFAEFLVDATIKYERFSDDIQTCGGAIDILVITKDTAFWKQHKIYNPQK